MPSVHSFGPKEREFVCSPFPLMSFLYGLGKALPCLCSISALVLNWQNGNSREPLHNRIKHFANFDGKSSVKEKY